MKILIVANLILSLLIFNPFNTNAQETKKKVNTEVAPQSEKKAQDNSAKLSKQSDYEKELEKKKIEADKEYKKQRNEGDPNNADPSKAIDKTKKETKELSNQSKKEVDQAKKEHEAKLKESKSKGELKGKDYGQARSAEARQKMIKSENAIKRSEANLGDAKKKIESAREMVNKAYKEKRISKEDYDRRMESISKYEQELKSMEKENSELKKEVNFEVQSANKKLDEAHKNKQLTDDEYNKRKEQLKEIENPDNHIKVEPKPPVKEKK